MGSDTRATGMRIKVAAVFGAGVVATMAALTAVLGSTTAHATWPMTGGAGTDTVTQTTPPPTPTVPAAQPQLKTPGWREGYGQGVFGQDWGHYGP